MNYSNVFGHTKRQFDMTMNSEKISVADYYNSDVKYDVFFRRNNRSTTPQSKVRFFYAQSTPITIGTIFVLNGENYIVTSQDGIESDIYFTSIANKCDFVYKVKTDKGIVGIPFVVVTDKWTVSHGTISQLNGAVALYTGYNNAVKNIEVNDSFRAFGNYYTVGNTFTNNNLYYLYLEQKVAPQDNYKITYTGLTSFDLKDTTTYQLTYTVTNNDEPLDNPSISYKSFNEEVATVDENGLMTMLTEGTVDIVATCGNGTCTTSMNIADTTPKVNYTTSISASTDTIKVGGSYKTLSCLFTDLSGNDITETTIIDMSANDFIWTCFIDGTEYTTDSMVVWYKGTAVNSKRVKLTSAATSYLGHTMTIKCTVNGVTASKDFEIYE